MLDSLDMLFADRKIGAAAKLAFLQLWRFAGGQPGQVVITTDWLGGCYGRRPRSAWNWLEDLQRHDLIEMGERNERRGSVEVFVFSPAPGKDREATPDPQMMMDLQTGNAADCEAIPDPQPQPNGSVGEAAGVSTQEPPSNSAAAGVSPQKPPQETPQKTPQKPPRPLVPKKYQRETKDLTYQSTKAPKNTKDTKESDATSRSNPSGETSMSLVAAFQAATAVLDVEPQVQKARLKQKIKSVCGGKVTDWVAGSAANLVVYHDVPEEDLRRILGDVQAMRDVGSLRDAGAFFHAKARQLAARHGQPWPRRGRQG